MSKIISIRAKNLRKLGYQNLQKWLENPNHIYIGRHNHYVDGATQSKWHNPFSVKKYGRDGCISEFEKYLQKNSKLMNELPELYGKTLGCWCKPDGCHGDVLVKLCQENDRNQLEKNQLEKNQLEKNQLEKNQLKNSFTTKNYEDEFPTLC